MLPQHVLDGDEVLERLGHLAAGDRQMTRVEEVADPVVVLVVGLGKETIFKFRTFFLGIMLEMCICLILTFLSTSDCASSLSWWGNLRSNPPECMSMDSPRMADAMTEHSMCHPGRPLPQGESQEGSPGLDSFHRAKSRSDLEPNRFISVRQKKVKYNTCGEAQVMKFYILLFWILFFLFDLGTTALVKITYQYQYLYLQRSRWSFCRKSCCCRCYCLGIYLFRLQSLSKVLSSLVSEQSHSCSSVSMLTSSP